jgi:aldehyde:ferredoxin oxidoreductase
MHGYAGSILVCDLSRQGTTRIPTSEYTRTFLGGRGLAARLYWQQAIPDGAALDPANPLIIATGPLAGFTGLAGSRWQICAKSPSIMPESFSYSNFGGSWGAYLKFAGFDALVIKGLAEKPTYLFLHDGVCELRDARHLWGMGTVQVREALKNELGQNVRVLTIGPAGENQVSFASLLADDDASGSSGFGAVMGSRNLKAVVVAGTKRPEAADPAGLRQLTDFLRELKRRSPQETPSPPQGMKARRQACFGCIAGCARSLLETAGGRRGKYLCTSGFFYESPAYGYYHGLNEVPFLATRLCDGYGLDANVIEAMIAWLARCYRDGILSDEDGGIPLSRIGSLEFIEELVRKIALRQDFGDMLARGTLKAAQALGSGAEKALSDYLFRDGTSTAYGPRMYITNALIFALEPRQSFPISGEVGRTVVRWLDWVNKDKDAEAGDGDTLFPARLPSGGELSGDDVCFIARNFWGGEAAADFSNYRGKALAAKMIQDRHYVKESAILCNFSWHVAAIEILRPEVIAELLSAVTGERYDRESVYRLGERIFNLQRAIRIRERQSGREDDTLPEFWHTTPLRKSFLNPKLLAPGPSGQPIMRKGSVLDRNRFELMKDEYYRLRGWDVATGLPTESKLAELGLTDVASELRKLNLTR